MIVKNLPISGEEVINRISLSGATSLPLIDRQWLPRLLGEARLLNFEVLPEVVGAHGVRQQLAVWCEDDRQSIFWQLATELNAWLVDFLPTWVFPAPLTFNEVEVLHYWPGSGGISAHRDRPSYINLICLCNITGGGQFFTCHNREGDLAIELQAGPGDVILMPGTGFDGLEVGPFHYVDGISAERFVCSARQLVPRS